MNFLKKHKSEIVILGVLTLVYLATRFYNILSLPIFTDEAIYVRWAQIAKQDANWRFISLTDGKQPMFIWLMMISLRLIKDPLLAGRMVSVGAGFFSLIGMYFLGREIFKSNRIGLISSALYVIYPMSLVYDKMALYDSLVGMFTVWALFLIILLVRTVRFDVAMILGMVAGGGVLTKTNAFFSVYLLPFSLLLFDWSKKKLKNRLVKWIAFSGVAVVITYVAYSILRLSPFFHIIDEKNAIFVYPLKEWLVHPFDYFVGNIRGLIDWAITYLTWPVIILSILSFFIKKTFTREKVLLLIWFIFPFVALGFFGRTIYPRFIFFMTLSLLPLVAFSLDSLFSKFNKVYYKTILLIIFFALVIRADYLILTNFSKAPIPGSDLSQYVTGWPAGNGVKEAVEFFQEEAKKGSVYIATEGTFGLMPYGFEIYLIDNPNIKIEGYWPITNSIPEKVLEESKKQSTYFFFYQPCPVCEGVGMAPSSWDVSPVLQFTNGENNHVNIYKIN